VKHGGDETMIEEIKMDKVACYKKPVTLKTDKKVNLIYGLNGTVKSIISNFLYHYKQNEPKYQHCVINWSDKHEQILVYNQSFINDNFYELNNQEGIFTLSKENKDAEVVITEIGKQLKQLDDEQRNKHNDKTQSLTKKLSENKDNCENKTWKIKIEYEQCVLDYCLKGLKGEKERLLKHLLKIDKPTKQPDKSIEQLKKDAEELQKDDAKKYYELPNINIFVNDIESSQLFQKSIIGNENSTISGLIKKLNNSDWVKEGFDKYIPKEIDDKGDSCPFCQQRTITKKFIKNISSYFEKTYENNLNEIKRFLKSYEDAINNIPPQEDYETNLFIPEKKPE
jgi:wobble nucleotide-excising tRNase